MSVPWGKTSSHRSRWKIPFASHVSVRGYGCSLTRSLGGQVRLGGEGDGMNEWLKGELSR
ncbi:hypothetical protein DCC84_21580 [Pseudomonas sp. SXM-1]|nr:hypothetical protein DCC84_21580 [Pseudomonas sp. SXM-1]